jgi:hypothetical protein
MKRAAILILGIIIMVFIAGCADITVTPDGQDPPTPTPVPTATAIKTVTTVQPNTTPVVEKPVDITFDKKVYKTNELATIKVTLSDAYYQPDKYNYRVTLKDNYDAVLYTQQIMLTPTAPHTGALGYNWSDEIPGGLYYGILTASVKPDGAEEVWGFATCEKEIITLEPTLPPIAVETLGKNAPIGFVEETETPAVTVVTPTPTPTSSLILPRPPVNETTPIPTPTPTPKRTLVPTDITRSYQDPNGDFQLSYPNTWTVTLSTVQLPDPQSQFKPSGTRQVTFQSEIPGINFTALTSDYQVKNNHDLDTTITYWKDTIPARFSDVAANGAMANFITTTTQAQTPYVMFDVTIPESSVYYPYAYTEMDLVSYSHFYTFRFNTDGNLTAYNTLKQGIFASLKTEERNTAQ